MGLRKEHPLVLSYGFGVKMEQINNYFALDVTRSLKGKYFCVSCEHRVRVDNTTKINEIGQNRIIPGRKGRKADSR